MPLLSPGVLVKEKDFTTIVPNVATTIGGVAGNFSKGPIGTPVLISTEDKLAEVFGYPNEENFGVWLPSAQFLGYTNKLWVVRAAPAGCTNASVDGSTATVLKTGTFTQANGTTVVQVKITAHGYTIGDHLALDFTGASIPADGDYVVASTRVTTASGTSALTLATVNTAVGHGLENGDSVVVAGVTPAGYNGTYTVAKIDSDTITYTTVGSDIGPITIQGTVTCANRFTVTATSASSNYSGDVTASETTSISQLVKNYDDYENKMAANSLTGLGEFIAKQPGEAGNALKIVLIDHGNYADFDTDSYADYSGKRYVQYMPGVPGTSAYVSSRAIDPATKYTKYDELSVFVIDETGEISGKANNILEVWNYVSKASDAIDYKNTSLFYGDVLNSQSQYVYWIKDPTTEYDAADNISIFDWSRTAFDVANAGDKFAELTGITSIYTLSGGDAGTTPTFSDVIDAYDELSNPEALDVNLLITGNHPTTVMAHVVEMAATRKDCIAFVTPHNNGVKYANRATMTTDLLAFKASLNISDQFQSYAVFDTGFKYIFDPYNRRYRWIALNGDIAGVCARTDQLTDPWWSPGGFNRGGIRNIIKLGFNPNQAERDILYPKGVNPVVTFPGSGTILFGDRTMQEKPSAFDRINVRRLFIVLEKAISTAAKYQLFEFNDSFTRAQFKNMVEPFLRDVQGRRGITDFKVICDESNNTGEVIDRNEFIADIYVKPARSINFIYLNFIATKTGVDFSTVIGG